AEARDRMPVAAVVVGGIGGAPADRQPHRAVPALRVSALGVHTAEAQHGHVHRSALQGLTQRRDRGGPVARRSALGHRARWRGYWWQLERRDGGHGRTGRLLESPERE